MELNEIAYILSEVSNEIDQLANLNVERTTSVQKLYSKAQDMAEDIKNITNILNSINSLSNSLKIISLNAKIEAAKAGEFGKTFSVVAEEVTKQSVIIKDLQKNANEFTVHINKQINWLTETLKKSVTDIETTTSTLEEINATVEEINNTMNKQV